MEGCVGGHRRAWAGGDVDARPRLWQSAYLLRFFFPRYFFLLHESEVVPALVPSAAPSNPPTRMPTAPLHCARMDHMVAILAAHNASVWRYAPLTRRPCAMILAHHHITHSLFPLRAVSQLIALHMNIPGSVGCAGQPR